MIAMSAMQTFNSSWLELLDLAPYDVFADFQFYPLTIAERTSASLTGDQRVYELAVLSGRSSDTSSLSFGPFASRRPSAATNAS